MAAGEQNHRQPHSHLEGSLHPSVLDYVGQKVKDHDLSGLSVLECGSRNVNGSVRPFFRGPYLGIDTVAGPDVDRVASANKIPFGPRSFDVVVCTEMLEHDPAFWDSIPEMKRVLRPGGHLLLTTRGIGFPFHEYPGDYWRFTEDAIRLLFDRSNMKVLEVIPDPFPDHPGVFGHARKYER